MGAGNNGASGDARMTEAEWVEEADEICAEFGAELDAPSGAGLEGGSRDPGRAGTADRRGRRRRLRDLNPPEATEEQVNEWLELNDENVRAIEELAQAAERR